LVQVVGPGDVPGDKHNSIPHGREKLISASLGLGSAPRKANNAAAFHREVPHKVDTDRPRAARHENRHSAPSRLGYSLGAVVPAEKVLVGEKLVEGLERAAACSKPTIHHGGDQRVTDLRHRSGQFDICGFEHGIGALDESD